MTYRWDPSKARANHRKHRIHFADAVGVFEDTRAVTVDDPHPAEERFRSLGLDLLGRLLVVCWTCRGDDIRIISARPATKREERQYHEEG